MTLEILDKTLSFLDHTSSVVKTQPKKEKLHYATKQVQLPTTHRSSAESAEIWTINWGRSIESTKSQEKIIQELNKYTKEASDKQQEKAEYETKPRRILNIKKLEIKGKPEENNNDKDESFQNINFFRISELPCTTITEDYLIHVLL